MTRNRCSASWNDAVSCTTHGESALESTSRSART